RAAPVSTGVVAVGGAALVLATYLLVAHSLQETATVTTPSSQASMQSCTQAAVARGDPDPKGECAKLFKSGVKAGAAAQRNATLNHLLTYSLLGLVGVTLL